MYTRGSAGEKSPIFQRQKLEIAEPTRVAGAQIPLNAVQQSELNPFVAGDPPQCNPSAQGLAHRAQMLKSMAQPLKSLGLHEVCSCAPINTYGGLTQSPAVHDSQQIYLCCLLNIWVKEYIHWRITHSGVDRSCWRFDPHSAKLAKSLCGL